MKRLLISLLVNFTVFSFGCYAYFDNGNDLYSKLGDWRSASTTNIVAASAALGYVVGVYDALDGITFCSPSNVNKNQVGDIVYNYLRDIPQIRQKEGSVLVSNALKQAFPCKK